MTRERGPLPDDELGADLEPVWDRLAEHASMAPAAGAQLHARVQAAMVTESERALRPARLRPYVVVRPLFRPSSIRSLTAAAALVALLGASVALAGAGAARLNQAPAVVPTPTPTAEATDDDEDTDSPAPIVQAPVQPGPDGIEDPDEADGDEDGADRNGDGVSDDEDGAETEEPGDELSDSSDDEDAPDADEPNDEPSHEPADDSGDEPSNELEAGEPD